MTVFHLVKWPVDTLSSLLASDTGTDIEDLPRALVRKWQRRVIISILESLTHIVSRIDNYSCPSSRTGPAAISAAWSYCGGEIGRERFYAAVESAAWETADNCFFELYALCTEQDSFTWLSDLIYWSECVHLWDLHSVTKQTTAQLQQLYRSLLIEEIGAWQDQETAGDNNLP